MESCVTHPQATESKSGINLYALNGEQDNEVPCITITV